MQSFASSNFPQSDAVADVVVARQATIAAEENVKSESLGSFPGLNFQLCDSSMHNKEGIVEYETTCADQELLHTDYFSVHT